MTVNARTSAPANARNGQASFTPHWRRDGYEYVVITRHDWHPVVWQRQLPDGEWSSHDIAGTVIGLVEATDSHCAVSLGVTADGIIHVRGNTHGNMQRAIRSVNPHDITEWEEAPPIPLQARYFTNLVENGVVENNTTGWAAVHPARYTADRVTHPYGWGSSHGNDTDCKAYRLTRTADTPTPTIGQGTIRSVGGSQFPATPGERYHASLSMRCGSNVGAVTFTLWIIFRNAAGSEISRVSGTQAATDSSKWYRPAVSGVAPVGTAGIVLEFRAQRASGNAAVGESVWADGAMLIESDVAPYDIVYRDGSYNGGYQSTGWVWNGTPYASTSTGPIETPGYAGLPKVGYDRFVAMSDGTLLYSSANPTQPGTAIGRGWMVWKLEPGDTNFSPIHDGDEPHFAKPLSPWIEQGSTYPVLTTGNLGNTDDLPDRVYVYGVYVDRFDYIHTFGWFRTRSELDSWGYVWYLRSDDRGATWAALSGEPVTMPITPDGIVDHSMMVEVDGEQVPMSGVTSVGVDAKGHPYVAGRVSGVGSRLMHWDGAQWESIDPGDGFIESPTWQMIDGDFWLFGIRMFEGDSRFCARNFTQDGPFFPLATTGTGTPDGSYEFESSAVFEGVPFHQGGSVDDRSIWRRCIPNGDEPRIVSVGDNVRGFKG